ncbi:hypothetical protein M0D69_13850 [Caballeronia sp. SEWSISQ10-4 2]|uniref:hypothetical protein n=1 Tax=Caballeronia sp. SEWSISQ10-4 2 TaxID=2937438 RepID=UPI002656F2F5|nr:hypothetical protein [Caballeronia sp. SEWSISQ10-4 2]MDN7179077.1 hypothetical protein [Caballeronia sp. SEWSISQ10-4 2]
MRNKLAERADSGVIQRLDIEADNWPALVGGCMIAASEHKSADHFVEGTDKDGGNFLALRWTKSSSHGEEVKPLPFKLEGHDEIAAFIEQWMAKRAVYPKDRPDTDGDTVRGFRIQQRDFYDVLTVKPLWIVYGK